MRAYHGERIQNSFRLRDCQVLFDAQRCLEKGQAVGCWRGKGMLEMSVSTRGSAGHGLLADS